MSRINLIVVLLSAIVLIQEPRGYILNIFHNVVLMFEENKIGIASFNLSTVSDDENSPDGYKAIIVLTRENHLDSIKKQIIDKAKASYGAFPPYNITSEIENKYLFITDKESIEQIRNNVFENYKYTNEIVIDLKQNIYKELLRYICLLLLIPLLLLVDFIRKQKEFDVVDS